MSRDSYPIIVLGCIIVALLIFFFIYSAVVARVMKRREVKLEAEMREITRRVGLEILVIVNSLRGINSSELARYKPSVSKRKVPELQARARGVVTYLLSSNYLRVLLIKEEDLEDEARLITKLEETKSNLWESHLKEEFARLDRRLEGARDREELLFLREVLDGVVKEIYWSPTKPTNPT